MPNLTHYLLHLTPRSRQANSIQAPGGEVPREGDARASRLRYQQLPLTDGPPL